MVKSSSRHIDLTGQVFGRLTVIEQAPNLKPKYTRWLCRCECGNSIFVTTAELNRGNTKSCGCLRRQTTIRKNKTPEFKATHTKHGLAKTSEYRSWRGMLSRCENKNDTSYRHYGKRGIKTCKRWHNFLYFLEDLGNKMTPTLQIERIDNDSHYSCGKCDECTMEGWSKNCRWATRIEQARNKTNSKFLIYENRKICIAELAEITGLNKATIRQRIEKEWPIEHIVSLQKRIKLTTRLAAPSTRKAN